MILFAPIMAAGSVIWPSLTYDYKPSPLEYYSSIHGLQAKVQMTAVADER